MNARRKNANLWEVGCSAVASVAVVVVFVLAFAMPSAGIETTTITTQYGAVLGSVMPDDSHVPGLRTFWGLPYAQAPLVDFFFFFFFKSLWFPFFRMIGSLRWKPPQEWSEQYDNGFFNATVKNPVVCYQPSLPTPGMTLSEDCLFLNIYSPPSRVTDQNSVPVMVFIHGGAYSYGSASDPLIDAFALTYATNTVVVTFNYRLGVFGFLALDELFEESQTTGNYGLLDQRMALQWVTANIGAFGGDTSRITLFGESAGAASVIFHLTMSASWGYFSRAISESPFTLLINDFDDAVAEGESLIEAVGCNNDVLECLRQKSAQSLLIAVPDTFWVPVVDSTEVVDYPLSLIMAGQCTHVPTIIGTNKDEGTIFVYGMFPTSMSAYMYQLAVTQILGGDANLAQKALALYPAIDGDNRPQLAQLAGDAVFTCPTRQFAWQLSQYTSDIFTYQFSGVPACPRIDPAFGSFHSAELLYLFLPPMVVERCSFSGRDFLLSRDMQMLWGTMAYDGVPSTENITWPTFLPNQEYFNLNYTYSVVSNLKDDKCDFWDTVYGYTSPDWSGSSSIAGKSSSGGGGGSDIVFICAVTGVSVVAAGATVGLVTFGVIKMKNRKPKTPYVNVQNENDNDAI
ncbi:carboxylesterase family protein [Pelomyxa schiedti]|nr:carboxylesterase family protein [Pelomyxa schiedti]